MLSQAGNVAWHAIVCNLLARCVENDFTCVVCLCQEIHLLQEIATAVKLEYGASRAGYALEVYLALQRLQTAAAGEAVVEAEDVQTLLDDLKVRHGFRD